MLAPSTCNVKNNNHHTYCMEYYALLQIITALPIVIIIY